MKRLLFLLPFLSFFLASTPEEALAQNTTCATRPLGDNSNACASTAFVQLSSLVTFPRPTGLVGNGIADDSTAIQAACTANPGKEVFIPKPAVSYFLSTDITQPQPYSGATSIPCSFIIDTGTIFNGPGNMAQLSTNTAQKSVGWTLTQWPSYGTAGLGYQTFAIETLPTATAQGNWVGQYIGAGIPPGAINGLNVLAQNLLAVANPGTGNVSINVSEDDYNDYRSDGFGANKHFTGNGSYNPGTAILFSYNGAHTGGGFSRWDRLFTGYTFDKVGSFNGKLNVDGSVRASPATGGIEYVGINGYALRIVPYDDTAGIIALYGRNSTDSTTNWSIVNEGIASFREFSTYDFAIATGVSIGTAGTGNAVTSQSLEFRSRTVGGTNQSSTITADINGSLILIPPSGSSISLQGGAGQVVGVATGLVAITGAVSATGQIISTLAIGTAPFSIISTTLVPNLYVARAALADTVTTNANLTGDVTSVGNATTYNSIVSGAKGGTGVANTGKTITIGASLTTTGAGAATLAFPASPFTYTYPGASQTLASLAGTEALTNKDLTGAGNTFPTFNQNTTGSAAKWTTARNLAGNSVDGSANVAFANKFIVQGTTDAGLSAAQFLGALGTGLVKNTTTTGVLSIASAGTDYLTSVGVSFTGGLISVGSSPLTANGTIALTVAGTSGGIPYFSSTSAWSSSALLAANALMIGGGAGAAPATTTTGTGVLTALGLSVSGSGSLCLTTSCVMVTPTLGVALATSINGLTISTTTGTFTLTNAKTLSISNTLTFAGTDSSTLNIGAGGTLASAAFVATGTSGATIPLLNGANTWSAQQTYTGNVQIGSSGGVITKVLRNTTFSGAFGTIAANSTASINITSTGVKPGDNCEVTPNGAVTAGIVWSCYISANDLVALVLANVTTAGVDPDGAGSFTWGVTAISYQ